LMEHQNKKRCFSHIYIYTHRHNTTHFHMHTLSHTHTHTHAHTHTHTHMPFVSTIPSRRPIAPRQPVVVAQGTHCNAFSVFRGALCHGISALIPCCCDLQYPHVRYIQMWIHVHTQDVDTRTHTGCVRFACTYTHIHGCLQFTHT
jgi:hypothetical protein